jgi:hypothetical protein
MLRFNGVSTKYLQNYMNWFSLLEETKRGGQGRKATNLLGERFPPYSNFATLDGYSAFLYY